MECLFTYRQLPSFAHFHLTSSFYQIPVHPQDLMIEEIRAPSGASGQDSFQGPLADLQLCVLTTQQLLYETLLPPEDMPHTCLLVPTAPLRDG